MRALIIAVLAVISITLPTQATDSTCDEGARRAGLCSESASGAIQGDEVVLEGSTSTGGGGGGGTSIGIPSSGPTDPERHTTCDGPCPGRNDAPNSARDGHVVTLSDIARFRPAPGIQRMEPDGWVVVGLPANIYSIVDAQIVAGELLGQSADVRFTPIGWRWDYGDGSTAALTTKGGTWAALGLREFDASPTSHVYRQAGSYTIRLSIVYRAEYRIAGGPFIPIAGSITLPANELHITASGAKTVLVDRDCTVAPRGPGC